MKKRVHSRNQTKASPVETIRCKFGVTFEKGVTYPAEKMEDGRIRLTKQVNGCPVSTVTQPNQVTVSPLLAKA